VAIKKPYNFMIDPDVAAALKRIKQRDGIAESEQIRRGIVMWLDTKGDLPTANSRRGLKARRKA
jgi:hypothetical protein